jgi:hypothetical protein
LLNVREMQGLLLLRVIEKAALLRVAAEDVPLKWELMREGKSLTEEPGCLRTLLAAEPPSYIHVCLRTLMPT